MQIRKSYSQGEHTYISFKTEAEAMAHFNQEKAHLIGYISEPWELESTEDSLTVWDGDTVAYQVILIK